MADTGGWGGPASTERLRELHDAYVWEINAAVGEGRMDMVWRLADEYVDEALRMMLIDQPGCDQPGCAMCERPRRGRPAPASRAWWHRLRRGA